MYVAKRKVHSREVKLNILFDNIKPYITIVIALKVIKLVFKFVFKIADEFPNDLLENLYEFEQLVNT